MDVAEYIIIQISIIQQECVETYNLKEKTYNGYIFAWVIK